MKCSNPSYLILRTGIFMKWDMMNPDNPGSSMPITIQTTHTCTS
ncbi:hypothetical protein EVA_20633 [gut metagenome]|uniref:Uncharacterized protein n=1 Tax=gut metagenome TaxID=749906 RepID=J9BUL2_9ZZZZ